MSTEKPTVVEALTRVMAAVSPVGKDGHNSQQNYKFRGIDAVVNEVAPKLREHGVIVLPEVLAANYRDVQTSSGKPSRECTVKVRYRFYGPAGDCIDVIVPGESMDFGDKGTAKAMSVAFRIALLQALCIPTGDADPDSQSYERASAPAGPSKSAVDLLAAISEATEVERLKELWEGIVAAYDTQQITEREANQLKAHIGKRNTEIEQVAA